MSELSHNHELSELTSTESQSIRAKKRLTKPDEHLECKKHCSTSPGNAVTSLIAKISTLRAVASKNSQTSRKTRRTLRNQKICVPKRFLCRRRPFQSSRIGGYDRPLKSGKKAWKAKSRKPTGLLSYILSAIGLFFCVYGLYHWSGPANAISQRSLDAANLANWYTYFWTGCPALAVSRQFIIRILLRTHNFSL